MTRQENNIEILEILLDYVKTHPDQRFGQILVNVGIVSGPNDVFYLESEEILDILSGVSSIKQGE